LNQNNLLIKVQYINLLTNKHIYLVEVLNSGNIDYSKLIFEINVQDQQVLVSIFDDRITTHDFTKENKKYKFQGKEYVKNENFLNTNISNTENITITEINPKKQNIEFDEKQKSYWYKISFDTFS